MTPTGKKQAEELGGRLKDKGIQVIFHSPKFRAKETAEIANKSVHTKLAVAVDLRERNNYGILSGLTKEEAEEKYPEEVEKLKTGLNHNVKNSEDYETFRERESWNLFNSS